MLQHLAVALLVASVGEWMHWLESSDGRIVSMFSSQSVRCRAGGGVAIVAAGERGS